MNGLESSEMESLSSTPADLTLEQNISTDAAGQRFGITSMTNPTYARQTWAESPHFSKLKLYRH